MFTPALFQFLRDLAANNRREWFQANRADYESLVRRPLQEFAEAFAGPLEDFSMHFIADKGSLFRIHRDVRFSADKSPYKTHAAAQFRHERGKDVHAPGFYLHLEAGGAFAGGGLWRPDACALNKVRQAIVAWPGRWVESLAGGPLEGESLSRPPRGYAADHPLIEDLKRKDFVRTVQFTQEEVCRPDFLLRFTDSCAQVGPLVRFLCEALDLPY